jgi:hypothetical protein
MVHLLSVEPLELEVDSLVGSVASVSLVLQSMLDVVFAAETKVPDVTLECLWMLEAVNE